MYIDNGHQKSEYTIACEDQDNVQLIPNQDTFYEEEPSTRLFLTSYI